MLQRGTLLARGDGGGGWELTPGWGRHGAGQVSCDAFNFSGHGEEEAGPPAETLRSGMQCCRREDWREVAGEESQRAGEVGLGLQAARSSRSRL